MAARQPFNVRLDLDVIARIRDAAEAKGTTASDYARDLVELALGKDDEGELHELRLRVAKLEQEVRLTRLSIARGFEAVLLALATDTPSPTAAAVEGFKAKLREGL